jgi:phage-related protein
MPITLPANLVIEKNKLASAGAWIPLIEVNLTNGTTYRFAADKDDITFNSNLYTAFPIDISSRRQDGTGEVHNLELKVSNITRLLQPIVEELDGGVGSEVIITIVSTNRLSEDHSELRETFEILETMCTAQWITFIIGDPSPLRKRFPLDRYFAKSCRFVFKGVLCGYVGSETTCERTPEACEAYNNLERFGGQIGQQETNVKIA